ncbi:hypothetical protein P9B03_12470 [Metasolibacillus meyeri]|uniref:DUF4825 domain-containing protein n=1 Tax=Metasolibacillus meyeri TaxID=1071052 RepID=A0AAW9NXM9_9BACL|nr:hypothetical protein [Metasolibacillus meyeri]MEC1179303.1 hypothetical protein [Metasolibacillus meyeri]
MKRKMMYILVVLFTIGSINIILKYNQQTKTQFSTVTHADWPEKNFEELTNEADVIAIVQVKAQKNKEEPIGEGHFLERKYSNLDVKKILKGNLDTEIVLNQAVDYIGEKGQYLMFLRVGEDGFYYELTDNAIVPYKNGKYISEIEDLNNIFQEEEIINEINIQMDNLSNSKIE